MISEAAEPVVDPVISPVAAGRVSGIYQRLSRRNRAIVNFFATSILARGISITCQLLQVPIALNYLGEEAFGLWITFTGFSYLLTVADFGIGLGAQNQMAEAQAVGDQRQARRVFFTAACALGLIGLLLMAVTVPLSLYLDWGGWLKLTDPKTLGSVHGAAVLMSVLCCGGMAMSLGPRLAYAMQLGWLNNVIAVGCNLMTIGGVLLAGRMNTGLLGMFAAVYVPGFILSMIMIYGMLRWLKWLDRGTYGSLWSFSFFDLAAMKKLLRVGALFFVQQVCDISLYTAPALVISSMMGAVAVTPFNIGQRLFSLFLVVQNALLPPLWPAYSEAKAMGDWDWVRRTLRRSMMATLLLTILPMTLASVFGGPVIRLWLGRHASAASLPTPWLLWLLFAWNVIVVLQQPYAFLLSGMSEVRRLSVYRVVTALGSIVLMFVLGPRFGLTGIVLGLTGATLVSLLGGVLETRRFLREASSRAVEPLPTPDAGLTTTAAVAT